MVISFLGNIQLGIDFVRLLFLLGQRTDFMFGGWFMKKLFSSIAVMAVLVLMLAACYRDTGITIGIGPMVTQDFDVSSFSAIDVSGSYNIIWRESSDVFVTIAAQENLLENFDVTVRGETLYVEPHRSFSITGGNTPRIYIYTPYLTGVSVNGSATIYDWDTIHSQNFSINVQGSANITLNLDVESLDILLAGSGNFDITGNVATASVVLNGSGRVNIVATDYLDIEINGSGSVRYTGNPTVTQRIAGIGTVQQAE